MHIDLIHPLPTTRQLNPSGSAAGKLRTSSLLAMTKLIVPDTHTLLLSSLQLALLPETVSECLNHKCDILRASIVPLQAMRQANHHSVRRQAFPRQLALNWLDGSVISCWMLRGQLHHAAYSRSCRPGPVQLM